MLLFAKMRLEAQIGNVFLNTNEFFCGNKHELQMFLGHQSSGRYWISVAVWAGQGCGLAIYHITCSIV